MSSTEEDDVALKLLHTADWHLGRRFRSFSEDDERKLTRARAEALDRIFGLAERHGVDAVLCAGDLFEDPFPEDQWWRSLHDRLVKLRWKDRPLVLLPGNHDPLVDGSVWDPSHQFRSGLPDFVHVVDRDDFELPLRNGATLFSRPCRSRAGQEDLALALPDRTDGDNSIRIGLVHGSTFDMEGAQTNFPIDRDAAVKRGLDYLAIGDTHGFRFVPEDRDYPPTIYPGAPEATSFGERDPGHVAVVLINRRRRSRVLKEKVAQWTWEQATVRTLEELEALADRRDLENRVLRLKLEMALSPPDFERAEALLQVFEGTLSSHGRVGILDLDRTELEIDPTNIDHAFDDMPDVIRVAAEQLQEMAQDDDEVARRALFELYRLTRKVS